MATELNDCVRMDEFRGKLDENGTIEIRCKLRKVGGDNHNSITLEIIHDFSTMNTSINSFKFVHRNYVVTILDIKCIESKLNKTTFLLNVTLFNKQSAEYSQNLFERILLEVKLNRNAFHRPSQYEFAMRFIKISSLLSIEKDKIIKIPLDDLNDQRVIKYVFQSTLLKEYNISLPFDIMSLLFDAYTFQTNPLV